VGEDVVDLVAAAAGLEPAHVGPLAIAILELGLRLRLELLAVAVVLLGEAEVDERAVPGVPEGHSGRCFACLAETPFVYKLPRWHSIRPHFKPETAICRCAARPRAMAPRWSCCTA